MAATDRKDVDYGGLLLTQSRILTVINGGTTRVSIPAPKRFKKTANDMPTTRFSRGKTLPCSVSTCCLQRVDTITSALKLNGTGPMPNCSLLVAEKLD